MEVNLKPFEDSIKEFLDSLAKEDELFAKSYAKPGKSIKECCQYIYQQVEKSRKGGAKCVACEDEEIYGLAIHYYDEDDIQVEVGKSNIESVQHVSSSKPDSTKETKKKSVRKPKNEDEDMPEPLVIPLFG